MDLLPTLSIQAQMLIAFLLGNLLQAIWGMNINIYKKIFYGSKATKFFSAIVAWVVSVVFLVVLSILEKTPIPDDLMLKFVGLTFFLSVFHFTLLLNKKAKYIAFILISAIGGLTIYYGLL